jgi:benzoate-CoA ligase family protein
MNMADYFLDERIREGRGDRTALYFEDRTWSYLDVQRMANQVANTLVAEGIRPEERVLICLPDRPEFAASFFGTLKTGAVVNMLNVGIRPEDLAYYLEYTRARALFLPAIAAGRFEKVLREASDLRSIFIVGKGVDRGFKPYDETVGKASGEFETVATRDDDPAVWLFTSGSTGQSKGAMHNHAHFPFNTERYAKGILGIGEEDITASAPKLFFGYATGTNLMFPFSVGAAAVLYEPLFSPEGMFQVIEKYRPSILSMLPTTINAFLNADPEGKRDLSSLKMVVSAGEALPPETFRKWCDRYGVEVLDGMGTAEMFHIYISNRPGEVVPGALGKIVPGYEARLMDDEGREVPAGEVGTLWIRGGSSLTGYWRDQAKSRATLSGEFVVTGDRMRVDADGVYWYAGRGDDLFKIRGQYVSPLEVEDCLLKHPAVAEAAVVDAKDGEDVVFVKAFVVPGKEAEAGEKLANEICQFAARTLSRFKAPTEVEFLESLPRTSNGKVRRKELRERGDDE